MTADALTFLADTPVRARLLRVLDRWGAARPSDLRDELDVSRATVHRNLSALTDRGWVRQTDAGYEATTAGVLVHDHYESFRSAVEAVERFETLLTLLPESAVPPLGVLETATLVTATSNEPHAPAMRYVQELTAADTDTVCGVSPVQSDLFAQAHEQLLEADVRTEILIPDTVLDEVRASEDERVEDALDVPGLEIYEIEGDPSFGVAITDDRAFLGGYDANNQLRAIAISRDEAFIDWTERAYGELRATAGPVTGQRAESHSSEDGE